MTSSDAWDVVVLGSGIAGLAGALAAHELGLRPIVLEKASTLGGGTVNSYGLIWVDQNHLAQAAGYSDTRDETISSKPPLGMARSIITTGILNKARRCHSRSTTIPMR